MNVDIRPRAERQIRAAGRWWLDNREKAPELFDAEVAAAIALIRSAPTVGMIHRTRRSGAVRRITLERIRYYLYYRIDAHRIEVISLWHTSRRPPRL